MVKGLPFCILQNTRFAAELAKQAACTSGFTRFALLHACSLQSCQALLQFINHLSKTKPYTALADFGVGPGESDSALLELSQAMTDSSSWFCFWCNIEATLSSTQAEWNVHSGVSKGALIASSAAECPLHWTKIDVSDYSQAIDEQYNFVRSYQALQSEY